MRLDRAAISKRFIFSSNDEQLYPQSSNKMRIYSMSSR
jgi:hypothetical protein